MRDDCQPSSPIVILCCIPEIFCVALMQTALTEIGVVGIGHLIDSHLG